MSRDEIAERDRELAAIYDHIPGIVFYIAIERDGDFRFVSMSQGGLAATGLSRERVVGRLVRHVIPPQSRELVLGNYREAVRTGRTVRWKEVSEYPAGRKIGEVAVTPLFDAHGIPTHIIGIVHDVTEHERLADAVRTLRSAAHSREFKLLLETATQGIVSIDGAGLIVTANAALERMFGWGPGELVGRSVETLMPVRVRDAHVHHRADYFGRPHPRLMGGRMHLVGERKDGSTFSIEVSLNHVFTEAGPRAYAFVSDITEREERTAELQRRTAQLSRLASDLTLAEQHTREQIARTLHDGLQQVLVTAALDLDRRIGRDSRQGAGDELLFQVKGHIDEAIAAARSLSLELFPPVLHASGLPAALRWLAKQTQSKYGVAVEVTADPVASPARKDVRTLLFESVRELLFNAVKHARVDRVTIRLTLEPDDTLRIVVEDAGVGFDPAELAEREQTGQVGWGLFSIRERVTLLGGRFEIESAPRRGTRFSLVAPRGVAPDAASVTDPATPALRILIADDHEQVRRVYRGLLEDHRELRVVGESFDGREAIAQAHALLPDVILMDVSMPNMDGIAATRQIRAELPEIEVLGLSMQPRTEPVHPIEQAGAAGFFVKGIETQALIEHLLAMQRAMAARAGAGRSQARDE